MCIYIAGVAWFHVRHKEILLPPFRSRWCGEMFLLLLQSSRSIPIQALDHRCTCELTTRAAISLSLCISAAPLYTSTPSSLRRSSQLSSLREEQIYSIRIDSSPQHMGQVTRRLACISYVSTPGLEGRICQPLSPCGTQRMTSKGHFLLLQRHDCLLQDTASFFHSLFHQRLFLYGDIVPQLSTCESSATTSNAKRLPTLTTAVSLRRCREEFLSSVSPFTCCIM